MFMPPKWEDLASKIVEKFKVPVVHVGIAYIHEGGRIVTLTSEKELQDFHASLDLSPLDSFSGLTTHFLNQPKPQSLQFGQQSLVRLVYPVSSQQQLD